MDGGYEGARCEGLVSGLRSQDYFERLQALSALFEILTFDSTAIFEYARPITFLPLLVPLLELNGGGGGWELGGEVAFQAARCLGFYLEAAPEIASEVIVRLGGAQHLVKWLESSEQIEFAETAMSTLSLIVKEQRLALVGDAVAATKRPCVSCSNSGSKAGEGVNPVIAILSIIDFLPLETQKMALDIAVKGCTHLPPKYWPLLVESIPVISTIIGTHDGDEVIMGLHASSALNLCCVCLRSVCSPRGEVHDGVSQPISCEDIVDELVSHMSSGLLEMTMALLASNTDVDIMCSVVEILTLLIQNSNKVRQVAGATSLLTDTCTFLSKLSKHTPLSPDLMTSTMVLMDELLSEVDVSEVGDGSLVKVTDGKGVGLFGGNDGRGIITRLEYGTVVSLLLSWVSDNGIPRHLVGIPPPIPPTEQSKLSPMSLDGKSKEPVVLGWVFGSPFSSIHHKVNIKHESEVPLDLVGLICDCVNMSERVDPVPVLVLSLLRRSMARSMSSKRVVEEGGSSSLEGSDGVAAILGGSLTAHSPITALQAIKLVRHILFNNKSELHENYLVSCRCLERHGVWQRLTALSKELDTEVSSLLLDSTKQVREEAAAVIELVEKSKFTPGPNPLSKCCEGLLAHMLEDEEMDPSLCSDRCSDRCSDGVEEALFALITMAVSVTPHQWNSSHATHTLITYFSTLNQTDVDSSMEVSLERLKRCRVVSFLRVVSRTDVLFSDLLCMLHRCITVETSSSSSFEVVLSKCMGGDPPAVTLPQSAESPPKGRIAKRLAELGALSSGLIGKVGQEKEEESEVRGEVDQVGGVGDIGLGASLSMLNQPLQLVTKLHWVNGKRRGTRRGGVTHGIPMIIEATAVLGSLTDYAMATAHQLGIGATEIDALLRESEGGEVSMGVSMMVAGVTMGEFRLVYSGEGPEACLRPQLKCDDESSSVSILHALYGAYREANKKDVVDDKGYAGIEMKASAPSFSLWEMTHVVEVVINCDCMSTDNESEPPSVVPTRRLFDEATVFNDTFGRFLCPLMTPSAEVSLVGSAGIADTLILLRLLRASVDSYELIKDNLIDHLPTMKFPPASAWTNKCITQHFIEQLGDPLVLSCVSHSARPSSLPGWMSLVARCVPFCLPLQVRSRWMHSTMFGSSHALRALHRYNRSELDMISKREREEITPPAAPKMSISINRSGELGVVKAAMRGYLEAKHRPERHRVEVMGGVEGGEEWERGQQLEASFEGEPGSGAGPTAEFFSLLSRSLASVTVSGAPLWRGQVVKSEDDDGTKEGLRTFFPWPLVKGTSIEESWSHKELMGCLGWILMQSLQDGHLIDLPIALPLLLLLSSVDNPLLGCRESAMSHLRQIDSELEKQLKHLSELARAFNVSKSQGGDDPIEAMCLDWTLPGRPDVSLKLDNDPLFMECTDTVTSGTFCLWMDRVLETSLLEDACLADSLKEGARLVGDPRMLYCFTPSELESLLLGDVSNNGTLLGSDSEYILKSIECDHGYTHDSPAVLALVDVLAEFNREDQVAFIQFVTGSPRLPLGGLVSLSPRLTVVRKGAGAETQELPSASTCTNYLKLPDYGSSQVLKERLLVAIHEGQGAFLLS